ncbi:MAG: metallophosphoesterase family protein [Actinomycetota bacterium]
MSPPKTPRPRRVAALYDLHGNLPALDAVLAEISRLDIDLIVVGGDVAWGPLPRATIDRLRTLETATFIRGNTDREVFARADENDGLASEVADINLWCADELGDERLTWMTTFRERAIVNMEGLGPTLFCHGSPRSDEEMLTVATPAERMSESLLDVQQATVVCGHTHMQFDIEHNGHRVVNAGSVGLPYEKEPGAYWALLGPNVELRRTTYDIDAALRSMADSGCPHVDLVFLEAIRQSPPQQDVIEHFERMAADR